MPLIFEDKYEGTLTATSSTNGFYVPSALDSFGSQSKITRSSSSLKRCSCSHLTPAPAKFVGMTTPRFALGSEILQASLTIIPAAARADLRGTSFRQQSCCTQELVPINRHSKSLDQLEHHNNNEFEQPKVEKSVNPNILKNINEFKAKYKNPGMLEPLKTVTLDRQSMKKSDELAHFNSLPKATRQLPPRKKHYSKHSSTLPKSKSSQNLNKLQRSNNSLKYSRIRISDYKRSIGRRRRSIRGGSSQAELDSSSSSTEDEMVYEKCKMPRRKKIFSSMSVPFKLEHFNGNGEDFSESLPNLAPPAAFRNGNGKKSSAAPSSEESGDISSDSTPTTHSTTKTGKSKSEFDLPAVAPPIEIDDIKLIPPEEFRDTSVLPLPPAQFRDTSEGVVAAASEAAKEVKPDIKEKPEPPKENGHHREPQKSHSFSKLNGMYREPIAVEDAFDNPLYHICDISTAPTVPMPPIKRPTITKSLTQAKILKSQSTNELFEIGRRSSSSTNCCSHASSPREIHRAIEVKKRDSTISSHLADADDKQPPLLEFEKSREEFRRQVNYNGAIYSDFTKLASELPYFYINDELRSFSPNGLHLIVCVHGKFGGIG